MGTFEDYAEDAAFRKALDTVDVSVVDGRLFMDIAAIPDINTGVAAGILLAIQTGTVSVSEDFYRGAAYMMQTFRQIHNGLLDLHAAELIPDEVPSDLFENP